MPQDLMRAVILAGLAVFCTGCASWGPWAPGADRQRGLAWPDVVRERSFQQILTLAHGERRQRFIAAGELCNGALVLALLTPQGIEALRLRHSRAGLEVRHARGLPPGVTPAAILADFQLIHWPAPALREAWGAPWALEVGPDYRQAAYRGEARVRVRYAGDRWTDPAVLEHATRGYRLRVQPGEHTEGGCRGSAGVGTRTPLRAGRRVDVASPG